MYLQLRITKNLDLTKQIYYIFKSDKKYTLLNYSVSKFSVREEYL